MKSSPLAMLLGIAEGSFDHLPSSSVKFFSALGLHFLPMRIEKFLALQSLDETTSMRIVDTLRLARTADAMVW